MIEYKNKSARYDHDIYVATSDVKSLDTLEQLTGTCANIRPENKINDDLFKIENTLEGKEQSHFNGCGWNLITLPFAETGQGRNYHILMNQYNEKLKFKYIDDSPLSPIQYEPGFYSKLKTKEMVGLKLLA